MPSFSPTTPLYGAGLAMAMVLTIFLLDQAETISLPTIRSKDVISYIHNSLPGDRPAGHGNFYEQDGMLQVDRSLKATHRQARFIPFNLWEELENAGMTGLEPELRLGDGFDILEDWQQALSNASFAKEAAQHGTFDFAKDKTFLILGDSVDRGTITDFCTLVGGTLDVRQFMEGEDLRKTSNIWLGDPHHCQLPRAIAGNSSIWTWMTYGSVATDSTFDINLANIHPRTLMPRYRLIAERLAKYSVKPDYVLMHTQMWDLNVNNIERTRQNLPAEEVLDLAFLGKVKRQLHQTLALTQELWPDAKKLYRILHNTRVDTGMWWEKDVPASSQKIPRTPYAVNKGEQLNIIVRNVIPQYGVVPFDLRQVLQGYRFDFRDAIHPGPVGHVLYSQLLLYWMKQLSA